MPQLTPRELIKMIFDDFKDFFIDEKYAIFSYRFGLKDELKVYRTGSKAFLNIPNAIDFLEIDNDESKFYLLFMIGHEIAHLTHRHLDHIDRDKFDSKTIEMWADFFGAKIAMAILMYGRRFTSTLACDASRKEEPLNEIFCALINRLHPVLSGADGYGKYLNSKDRISTMIAGIAAYLTRNEMWRTKRLSHEDHARIGTAWGYTVNSALIKSGLISKLLASSGSSSPLEESDEFIHSLVVNSMNIHKSLKRKEEWHLIKGLRFNHVFSLDTAFESATPNPLLINSMNAMAKQVGWSIDEE